LSLTLGDTWTVGENATLLIDLSAGNCAVLSNPALTGGFLPGVGVKDSIATGPATVVAGQIVRYIPPTLTSSSNDANLGFSSLNSTYPGGILDWTDGGLLTNRAVHRLILDTTLTGGTIDLGAPANILTLSSGEIQFLGTNDLTLTGGQLGAADSAVSLTTAGTATLTLASPISSGTGSLSISGSANVILNSANSFTGGLTLDGGALKQGVAGALGPANGTLTINSGLLDLNGLPTGIGSLTGSGGSITSATAATLTLGNNNATGGNFAGSISGGIALTKTGGTYTNTATLSGANTYGGITTLGTNSGSLVIAHNSALGSSPSIDVVGSGTALVLANNITVTGKPITIRGTGTNNGSAGNFSGPLTTAANATATWTGSITLGDGNGRLGAGNNGTLYISGPILGSGTNQNISLSSGSGANIGTVVLSGPNNFTGNISIVRGYLKLGAANTLPATAIIDVGSANIADNTSFDLDGFPQTLAGLRRTSTNTTQVSTVTNSSATAATLTLNQSTTLAYSGRISGNLTLAKSGTGTLALTRGDALASSLSLTLDDGALSISTPHTITALRINGVWQAAGTYTAANSSGRISGTGSLIVTTDGPAGFFSWINGFTTLTANDKFPTADPDADGINNLLEYVLNGSPTLADPAILPDAAPGPTHFLFSFTRREESAADTTQIFEYGSTLTGWTPVNITAPTAPEVSFGTTANGIRSVTVSIPLSAAPDGHLFGRLKVTQP
jgi:autotransporter-associated beta strand protein